MSILQHLNKKVYKSHKHTLFGNREFREIPDCFKLKRKRRRGEGNIRKL